MTDRVRMLHVVLQEDMRTDDVESIVLAISMVKGVAVVKYGPVVGPDWVNRVVVRRELRAKLLGILDDST